MKRIATILFAISPIMAKAQSSLVPADFFVDAVRNGVSLETKELSPTSFEIEQRIVEPTAAQSANLMAFCTASFLANSRGHSGWSAATKPASGGPNSKALLTVILLKSADDASKLPADSKWLPYMDLKRTRAGCARLVNAKYLWPEG